jgi:hypothetical protein
MKTDTERSLAVLEELAPTPLRSEIERRLGAGADRPVPDLHGTRNRLTAAVLAIAVFGAAAAFAWTLYERHRPILPQVPADPWSWVGEGWDELPAPPEWREAAAVVWAEHELLYWGSSPRGSDTVDARADGYAFDPASRSWTPMPSAPVALANPTGIWTGREAIFWGGSDVLGFDPATEQWRVFPPSPHPARGHVAVWTGDELIFWGGGPKGSEETHSGAALVPSTGAWHPIADAPVGLNLLDGVWTGSQMVVVGSEIDTGNHATTETAVALTYDPTQDIWRRLPDPPVSAQTAAIADVGGRLIAWELYSPAAAEFLPGEEHWRSLDMDGLGGGECYAQGVTLGGVLFTWDCGEPAAWYAGTSSWVRTGPPAKGLDAGYTYSFGAVYAAGPVAVIEHIETVDQDGIPYVGSPGVPVHLWVWRLPATPLSSTHEPDASDAELVAERFVDVWLNGPPLYLPGFATADLLERMRGGVDVPADFADRSIGDVRFVDADHVARALDGARFEVRIARKDGSLIGIFLGPGRTADGRDARIVVTDVRAID